MISLFAICRTKLSFLTEEKRTIKKETFMQGVVTIMFSQILIKVLGLIYTLYLTNRDGFGDAGNAIYASGYQIYALLLQRNYNKTS